jgi:integrase
MIVNLDTIVPDRLFCPEGKRRVEYVDTGGSGLYLECRNTSPGEGTFYLRYKDANKKTCHVKIGRTTDIDLAEARRRAKVQKAEITLGKDPRAEQKALREAITFHDFFQNHYLPHVKSHKRTWKDDSERYDLRLKKAFGHKKLTQIRRQEIQSFHASIRGDGLSPASADHYVKLLRHCLNLAMEWEMLEKNPASRIQLFLPDNKVEHYLEDEELERLLEVLRTDKNRTICLIALFLLCTGARLNEVLQATWRQCDRKNRVWRISASTSKSKKVRSVPLNDSALEVLDQLNTEGRYDYLFINRKTGKPFVNIFKPWNRLRKKAGLPHLRCHDLRHLYASFLVNSGRTLYEVQQILGHSNPTVTQRYAHLSTRSLQDAADSAAVVINGAMKKSA